MVNELQTMKVVVVKAEEGDARLPRVTSSGGLVLAQRLAQRLGLWKRVRRDFPARKDPAQGYPTEMVVAALAHGLLAGGCGLSATEPMRGDAALAAMLGLSKVPSAETVEEVVKFIALERGGAAKTNPVVAAQAASLLGRSPMKALRMSGGFVPVWVDGSLLEVVGKKFDAIKVKDSRCGQMCVGAFCGPYLTAVDFAGAGEGEMSVGRRLMERTVEAVLRPLRFMDKALLLVDSLYGNGPTLDQIEGYRERPAYIAGAMGLDTAMRVARDLPEALWIDTGAQRGWEASAVAEAWVQCEQWPAKRALALRRWRAPGEIFWNYAAVITNLTSGDPRVAALMKKTKATFAEVIWDLYGHKQAMENQWKDLLRDMALHHPPCAKAAVNAVFYCIAALAYNLAIGVRRLALNPPHARMALWRLRRDFFQLAAYARRHARTVAMRFLDTREHLSKALLAAMGRVARL